MKALHVARNEPPLISKPPAFFAAAEFGEAAGREGMRGEAPMKAGDGGLYQLLGVAPDASQAEIKCAARPPALPPRRGR